MRYEVVGFIHNLKVISIGKYWRFEEASLELMKAINTSHNRYVEYRIIEPFWVSWSYYIQKFTKRLLRKVR